MRTALRAAVLLALMTSGAGALVASGSASGAGRAAAGPFIWAPGSTREVCVLTGSGQDGYGETYTASRFGLVAGDRGYSFEFQGKVWWLFGDSRPSTMPPWGANNANARYPGTLLGAAGLDNDSMAFSSVTRPPKTSPGRCPVLTFVTGVPVAGAYANPSVTPDPLLGDGQVSLRTNESAVAGISEDNHMFVVFETDDPLDNGRAAAERRVWPEHALGDGGARGPGHSSVQRPVRPFSAGHPLCERGEVCQRRNATRQRWLCLYLGDRDGWPQLPVPRADPGWEHRQRGQGWSPSGDPVLRQDGVQAIGLSRADATPLFRDRPKPCMGQLGVQYNSFLGQWVMLYGCRDNTPRNPAGIYMRTAANPWGPWSAPQTIFNPQPNATAKTGYCYFIHVDPKIGPKCPKGAPNPPQPDALQGDYYGPYFVADWTIGRYTTATAPASSTFYYTLDTLSPYGQVLLKSTVTGRCRRSHDQQFRTVRGQPAPEAPRHGAGRQSVLTAPCCAC